jgi:hypothetical protein
VGGRGGYKLLSRAVAAKLFGGEKWDGTVIIDEITMGRGKINSDSLVNGVSIVNCQLYLEGGQVHQKEPTIPIDKEFLYCRLILGWMR